MPYQTEMFSEEDAFRSSDNRGLGDVLREGKAFPFVKWAGGKRSIIDKISGYLPLNIEIYHEPFVGGGAVFFGFENMIKSATLADLNEELVLAYHTVANNTDNLIEALQKHERNHSQEKGYYMKVRKQDPKDILSIAARFLYLNKTCFNGLYRVNKSGKFNVPQGKYKNPKICNAENLKRASEVLKKAVIHVLKFGRYCKIMLPCRKAV
ncbi:MAG: Dam family site-specific DNA-(adenine-N6)-methyltransferase, partial [Candidatus Poribacteria bacterium]|nr:Dam family site-specific DNA-(adenine-N6)-methyltransferase [Candidatus Poribacteria bacterium]